MIAGLIQPDSGQFGLVHWQMRAAAGFASSSGPAATRLREAKRAPLTDLGGGVRYAESSRHVFEVEHWSYQRHLKRLADSFAHR